MGKASNQKKKRRQGTGVSRADLESQRAVEQLARAAQKLSSMFEARREHVAAVSRYWWRGAEPEAAEVPDWAEGSAGDRFFENSRMKQYAVAPRLATAEIPSAEAFAADSGHWDIAVSALIRAVVLDQVPVTDPLVTKVIRLLGPAVDAEVQYAASGGRGTLLFGELDRFSGTRFAILSVALLAVLAGVLLIVSSQGGSATPPSPPSPRAAMAAEPGRPAATARGGLIWAGAAGLLWGSYFVPAQWAAVPAQVGNFPLAIGILGTALALALPAGEPVRLGLRPAATQLGAGVLFGIGDLTLLGLVARVGTGTGFTIAQLSLLVNASIGIWAFHMPKPGTPQARKVLAGILIAGAGGCVIGTMR